MDIMTGIWDRTRDHKVERGLADSNRNMGNR